MKPPKAGMKPQISADQRRWEYMFSYPCSSVFIRVHLWFLSVDLRF